MSVQNWLVVFSLATLVSGIASGAPLSLNSKNTHYFQYQGKTTVLVTSGEHYGAVINGDFNYVRYLDELARNHLNLTRVWSGTYREVPGNFHIGDNTLAPRTGSFVSPWLSSNGRFDLTRWNPAYFARLRRFLEEASRRGILVELNLFCTFYEDSMWKASPLNAANNINGVGAVPRSEVLSLQHPDLVKVEDEFTRKIVREVNPFDNLYFEICNEPYAGNVPSDWQRHISQVIVDVEKQLPKRHLISQNVANGSLKIVDPDPNVSIFNFHYARPPKTVELNYGLRRAIGFNETGFDGQADSTYREQGWAFLTAGGALYNNLDYSFTVGHENGDYRFSKQTPGGGSAELRRQLGVLGEFFRSLPLDRMKPMHGIMTLASHDPARFYVLADPGTLYVAYLSRGDKDTQARESRLVLHLPAGSYQAQWIEPKSGKVVNKFHMEQKDDTPPLSSPLFTEDIVLKIWHS